MLGEMTRSMQEVHEGRRVVKIYEGVYLRLPGFPRCWNLRARSSSTPFHAEAADGAVGRSSVDLELTSRADLVL